MFLKWIEFTDSSLPRWKYSVVKSSTYRYFWTLNSVQQAGMVKKITMLSHLPLTLNRRTVAQKKITWNVYTQWSCGQTEKNSLLSLSWKHWKTEPKPPHFSPGNPLPSVSWPLFSSFSYSFSFQRQVCIHKPFLPFPPPFSFATLNKDRFLRRNELE